MSNGIEAGLMIERANDFTAWVESVRQELGTEEAREAVMRSWLAYCLSLKRVYGLDVVTRALEGTSDFEKFKGAPSAVPCRFTLAELIAAGISDEGLVRVIVQANAAGSSDSCKPCWCKCSGLCLVVSQEEFEEFQDNLEKHGGTNA